MKEKQGRNTRRKNIRALSLAVWSIVFIFVGVAVMYLFTLAGAESIKGIVSERDYWLCNGVIDGLILIGYLFLYRVDAQNIALEENDLDDTDWLTKKEIKKSKEFTLTSWKKLPALSDGIVLGAKKKGRDIELITTSALHALIVGTTGSGKTTGFVDQNIAVLARSKGKPSLLITDPKKELYEKHAKTLREEGYTVSVLDLREPYSSVKWNPLNVLLRRIRLIKDLEYHL